MRAVVVNKTGPPDVLEVINEYPLPELRDGEELTFFSEYYHHDTT